MIQPETGFPDLMVWKRNIQGWSTQGIVLKALGRYSDSLAYERTVPLLQALYGPNPTDTAWVASTWASICLTVALGECLDAGFPSCSCR